MYDAGCDDLDQQKEHKAILNWRVFLPVFSIQRQGGRYQRTGIAWDCVNKDTLLRAEEVTIYGCSARPEHLLALYSALGALPACAFRRGTHEQVFLAQEPGDFGIRKPWSPRNGFRKWKYLGFRRLLVQQTKSFY